jgi:hypothetical protein
MDLPQFKYPLHPALTQHFATQAVIIPQVNFIPATY